MTVKEKVSTLNVTFFSECKGSPASCFHGDSTVMSKKTWQELVSSQPSPSWQETLVDFSSYLPSLTPCSHLREHISLLLYVFMCECARLRARVCIHMSKTQRDLVSSKGLGSPGPARCRPDSAAELINISPQSKVGSAMRPQGCTNWWKLTAGKLHALRRWKTAN